MSYPFPVLFTTPITLILVIAFYLLIFTLIELGVFTALILLYLLILKQVTLN